MEAECRPCAEVRRPVSAITVAIVVVLAVVIICYLASWIGRRRKEGFVSQKAQEVYSNSKALFDTTRGDVSYSTFKTRVPGADPVTYTDVRKLWRGGNLTPEAVQGVI